MSVIGNIGILQSSNDKKAFSKISFEVGEKFNARIVSVDQQKGEVNLKLLDGWQFSAKLDKPLSQNTDGSLVRFEVEGFEEDKLIIKLVYDEKEGKTSESNILEDFNKGRASSADKLDVILFEKMVKHDMPLTKENIIDIKNIVDFKEKIILNVAKEEIFIEKYLNSRGVNINSEKGEEITRILKDFFHALKDLSVDEILLFKENNIELTKGNVDSFMKLFKGESAIYNSLKDINSNILNNNILNSMSDFGADSEFDGFVEYSLKDVQTKGKDTTFVSEELSNIDKKTIQTNMDSKPMQSKELITNTSIIEKVQGSDNASNSTNLKEMVTLINQELVDLGINHRILNSTIDKINQGQSLSLSEVLNQSEDFNTVSININKGTIKDLVSIVLDEQQISLSPDNRMKLINNLEEKLNPNQLQEGNLNFKNIDQAEIGSKSPISNRVSGYSNNNSLNEIINMIKKELGTTEPEEGVINNIQNKTAKITTDLLIKDQIKFKTEEIKNIITDIIENKLNLKPESYEKVMNGFSQRMNDIKIFNSLSEQYYYLDLPINVKEDEYQLKLIIKDDRKKGKKIDSKNVKIATRVKTVNMGTVEAFIKINNNNMSIDINCDKQWVRVLDLGKEKLIKDLSTLNYRVNVSVSKKAEEFTLTTCRKFFDDRSFNAVNVKV